jgi:methionine-rich copper-binding protein CopC
MLPRTILNVVVIILALVAGVAAMLTDAAAHSVLKSRQPSPDAKLSVPPNRVDLVFNEDIEGAFSEIKLLDRAGAEIAKASGKGMCAGAKCSLVLPVLGPGIYSVSYRVLSQDGHVVQSQYEFTVVGP